MTLLRLAGLVAVAGFGMADASQARNEEPLAQVPLMPEERLLIKVRPEYPSAAIRLRIEGTVEFTTVIARDGHIERLRLISGHPLLARAAREAARQWVYRPIKIGGEPVRVLTKILVHFRLDPSGKPVKDRNPGSKRTAVHRPSTSPLPPSLV